METGGVIRGFIFNNASLRAAPGKQMGVSVWDARPMFIFWEESQLAESRAGPLINEH